MANADLEIKGGASFVGGQPPPPPKKKKSGMRGGGGGVGFKKCLSKKKEIKEGAPPLERHCWYNVYGSGDVVNRR